MAVAKVRTALGVKGAGLEANPVLHASGVKVRMDWREYLALEGYVFISASNNLGNFELGETGADNQDIDLLEPSFMFDIPKGITVIPMWANVALEVDAGVPTDVIMAIVAGSNEVYSSGGTAALAALNARTDGPRGSTVRNLFAVGESGGDITAGTMNLPKVLWIWSSPTDPVTVNPYIIEFKPEHQMAIVGPGCFCFYCHSITANEQQFRATFAWAELPTGLVSQ